MLPGCFRINIRSGTNSSIFHSLNKAISNRSILNCNINRRCFSNRERQRYTDRIAFARASGGSGGIGCYSFERRDGKKGRADGGNGGDGGDVRIVASSRVRSLYIPCNHIQGKPGLPGGPHLSHGRRGADKTIYVPMGTVVTINPFDNKDCGNINDENTTENDKQQLIDLYENGAEIIIAKGAKGGAGNRSSQIKVPKNQPAGHAVAQGEDVKTTTFALELKSLADVGLVGFPNSGKSTLLAALSNAKPKIAPYAFTTIVPNLGVVFHEDQRCTMADIPGLILGAHANKGLGHDFLRHIERTKVLIFVLDYSNENPLGDLIQLQQELHLYRYNLHSRPAIIFLNKSDIVKEVTTSKVGNLRVALPPNTPILTGSGYNGENLNKLREEIFALLERAKTEPDIDSDKHPSLNTNANQSDEDEDDEDYCYEILNQ